MVTSIARILIGAGVIGLILWKVPILELLQLFLYIVLVPLSFLASVGLISQGSLELIMELVPELRRRIEQKMHQLRERRDRAVVEP